MALPHFLIIGAMKAGTTSLFMDLSQHPRLFLPKDIKEPHYLCSGDSHEAIAKHYAELFAGAGDDQLCGEASTGYTKRPQMEGVAERALELLGPDLRVVYLIRDPIERMLSHYRHETIAGEIDVPLEEAVRSFDPLLQYSRYGYQVEPWVRCFGADRVRVLRFEDYTAHRAATVSSLGDWLGAGRETVKVNEDQVYNRSAHKPVVTPVWQRLRDSKVYRQKVRPLLPLDLRLRLMRLVLPHAAAPETRLSPELVAELVDRFEPDQELLAKLMDREDLAYSREQLAATHRVGDGPSHA